MKFTNWIHEHHLLTLIGLTGVEATETRKAKRWNRIFNYAVVVVAIVLLLQWQMEILHTLSDWQSLVVNLAVWLFFVLEYTVLICFVRNRKRYLVDNWLLPVIILIGISLLIKGHYYVQLAQFLRPLLAIVILSPAIKLLFGFFIDGKLRTTLFAAAIIVVIFGLLVDGVDPNIKSAWDGIWWAVVTASTVGYGDQVPTSPLGRLLAVGLIVLGLMIFVVITANILTGLLKKEVTGVKREEQEVKAIRDMLIQVQKDLAEIKKTIRLSQRKSRQK